ncbi:prefoldin subunit alpha [Natrononativus amylolyticus]|uniref:prefoldin subunit alpha n=1 Tax=Natrononativus amylolyticus TaxID=2963434 RepID=UPI0020CF980C|nr:prefoldin subunit alpha [Natrononativus amylolyticus]
MSASQQELQELSQQLQELQEQIEALETSVEAVRTEQGEVDEAITALEQLETGSVVQVPLGGGAYVRAEIEDIDEAIVELGADYAAEFEREGAVSALENKKERLDDDIEELTDQIADLEAESAQLEGKAQQLQQQAMQQQMQQMQGQQNPDE